MAITSAPSIWVRSALLILCLNNPVSAALDVEEEADVARESPFSAFLYGAFTARELNSRSNTGNAARVPLRQAESAAVVEYHQDNLWGRLRLNRVDRYGPTANNPANHWENEAVADLTQFSWKLPFGDMAAFTVGRINLGLDDGQSFHPLDFFEDAIRSSDFDDRAGRYRGFPLVMVTRSDALSTVRLVYSDDRGVTDKQYHYGDPNPNYNRGIRQWMVSWRGSFEQLTAMALARRNLPGSAGLGIASSFVANAAWSMHGAAYAERGNPLPVHRNVFLGRGKGLDASDVYINDSPMQSFRADDHRIYSRWLVGSTWTTEGGSTLVAEVWRDDRGMDARERRIWREVMTFHSNLSNEVARRINIGFNLEALRVPNGTHLFVRLSTPFDEVHSLQASALVGEDRSGSATVRWTGRFDRQWEGSLEVWRRFGGPLSSYGETPDRTGALATLRFFF